MIRAFIFDLDGTLVQTERLKAEAYGLAAAELSGGVDAGEVMDACRGLAGKSRRETCQQLLERFGLKEALFQASPSEEPWRVLATRRLEHYRRLLADSEALGRGAWAHNKELEQLARRHSCRLGLATLSPREQVLEILSELELEWIFDAIATVEDVECGKPDPEIFQVVAEGLGVAPEQCLAIEHSHAGVEAAQAAGMACLAVETSFSGPRLREGGLLPADRLVGEGESLIERIDALMETNRPAALDPAGELKKQAGETAADLVAPGMVVGLGHGSTAAHALRRLADRFMAGDLEGLRCVPCSEETGRLAASLDLPLVSLDEIEAVDLTIDGADEVDADWQLIKGGGGALLREKVIAQISRREVIIVDESKLSGKLGERWAVPVEVVPFAAAVERRRLEALGARVELRRRDGRAFTTDQGNHILDAAFGPIADPASLAEQISRSAGVVEHGLFVDLTSDLIVAGESGVRHGSRGESEAP